MALGIEEASGCQLLVFKMLFNFIMLAAPTLSLLVLGQYIESIRGSNIRCVYLMRGWLCGTMASGLCIGLLTGMADFLAEPSLSARRSEYDGRDVRWTVRERGCYGSNNSGSEGEKTR